MIRPLFLALSLALGAYAPQQAGSEPLEPRLEARVQSLAKVLRCAVCQGLSIADSPASMARAQLDKVRELVAAGKSDEEVRAYFVERYGEWVLLEPTMDGGNLLVWFGPGVLIFAGLIMIVRMVKSGEGEPAAATPAVVPLDPAAPANPEAPPASSGDPYLDAVRAELKR